MQKCTCAYVNFFPHLLWFFYITAMIKSICLRAKDMISHRGTRKLQYCNTKRMSSMSKYWNTSSNRHTSDQKREILANWSCNYHINSHMTYKQPYYITIFFLLYIYNISSERSSKLIISNCNLVHGIEKCVRSSASAISSGLSNVSDTYTLNTVDDARSEDCAGVTGLFWHCAKCCKSH